MIRKYWYVIFLIVVCVAESSCYRRPDRRATAQTTTGMVNEAPSQIPWLTEREKRHKFKQGFVYVIKVVDGDTFWIDDGKEEIKVRFIGIDAPETRNAGRKKRGYFGKEATAYVKALSEHRWVRLETDIQERDRYKRLLAYVYLEDGTFLNAHLVENGYAVADTHPPNVKYVDLFVKLQQDAKMGGLGLWRKE